MFWIYQLIINNNIINFHDYKVMVIAFWIPYFLDKESISNAIRWTLYGTKVTMLALYWNKKINNLMILPPKARLSLVFYVSKYLRH